MTQAPLGTSFDEVLQFDLLEQTLENWRDQLTRLSPYLSSGEVTKLSRRWDSMRQNLDIVLLNYGRSIQTLPFIMDDLPALRTLSLNELEMTLEAFVAVKKNLTALVGEAKQRLPLLEQALNLENKPTRVRRSIEKMLAIDDSLQRRMQEILQHRELWDRAFVPGSSLLEGVQKAIDQTERIEALQKANDVLSKQKLGMQKWLNDSQTRLEEAPVTPPPSAEALGRISRDLLPRRNADLALENLFSNREKLREARRYLEAILPGSPEDKR